MHVVRRSSTYTRVRQLAAEVRCDRAIEEEARHATSRHIEPEALTSASTCYADTEYENFDSDQSPMSDQTITFIILAAAVVRVRPGTDSRSASPRSGLPSRSGQPASSRSIRHSRASDHKLSF